MLAVKPLLRTLPAVAGMRRAGGGPASVAGAPAARAGKQRSQRLPAPGLPHAGAPRPASLQEQAGEQAALRALRMSCSPGIGRPRLQSGAQEILTLLRLHAPAAPLPSADCARRSTALQAGSACECTDAQRARDAHAEGPAQPGAPGVPVQPAMDRAVETILREIGEDPARTVRAWRARCSRVWLSGARCGRKRVRSRAGLTGCRCAVCEGAAGKHARLQAQEGSR